MVCVQQWAKTGDRANPKGKKKRKKEKTQTHEGVSESASESGQSSINPLDPIQLPRRLRIRLRILTTHRKMHRMSPPHITPNHPLMRDILPHLPPQLLLDA